MSTLAEILASKGVKRAAIIDDAFDVVPLASDLGIEEPEWIQFFEDLTKEDSALLESKFAGFREARADDLMLDNGFVAVLWRESSNLSGDGASKIFERYREDHDRDLEILTRLEAQLLELDLECETCGRTIGQSVYSSDIIFVDLFMGSLQDDSAFNISSELIRGIISRRKSCPPLVILMSRSTRLKERRAAFRDEAELLESCFRIIQKSEISSANIFPKVIRRLALYRDESTKLASFLHALEDGVANAGRAAVSSLRKLAPSDHAQIQNLLLNEEGEPLGAYLVDVFDALVLHELERDHLVVKTAGALSSWDTQSHPPPYLEDARDLQYLVYQSMFHRSERMTLSARGAAQVSFGDILKRRDPEAPSSAAENADLAEVWLVITPACDLLREGPRTVLLVAGKLEALHPKNWVYTETPVRTPVIVLENDRRFRIRWDTKHLRTIEREEMLKLQAEPDGWFVCARLRYVYALELQQKVLSSLGRVGVVAPMPATFYVDVSLHLLSPEGMVFAVDVASLKEDASIVYVGRAGQLRLSLCEEACDEILDVISALSVEIVHPDAQELFASLQNSDLLLRTLEAGLLAPAVSDLSLRELKLLETDQSVGYVSRNPPERITKAPMIKKFGLLLKIVERQ